MGAHLTWRTWRGATGVALLAGAQMAWRIWRGAFGCSANGNKPSWCRRVPEALLIMHFIVCST
jgi:hypothetical protein